MSLAHPTDTLPARRDAYRLERTANRVAVMASVAAGITLVGAGILLWSREGIGVFMEVLAAGLSACF
jgi:hypothetical protein